jgi:hypothetical protein
MIPEELIFAHAIIIVMDLLVSIQAALLSRGDFIGFAIRRNSPEGYFSNPFRKSGSK